VQEAPSSERAAALIASATSFNLRRARRLLRADPALARQDLACACVTGEADDVSRRIEAEPAAVSGPAGPYDWEPLLYACFSRLLRGDPERAPGIREVARRLLAAGADPNAVYVNDHNWIQVALYGAAGINGDPELTAMLLDAGADPTDDREGFHGNEVLYHACEHADPTCARLVIEAGAMQDFVDYDLGRALNFPNHEMIEVFCERARPWAAHLHQAVWRRRPPQTIAALLDAGAPLDEPDEHGLTPLQIATLWGEDGVAQLLRDRGADQTEGTAVEPSPSLLSEMLILAIQGGHFETMCRLLDSGARVDGDPESDDDPLGQACWRGRVEIARELVRRGAALTFREGRSAIGAALHGSRHCQDPEGGPTMQTIDEIDTEPYAEIVKLLIAAGATVPDRMGPKGRPTAKLLAELGIEPPPSASGEPESREHEP
jgi:ankyrin repeat protein